jgi:hypothetical protein
MLLSEIGLSIPLFERGSGGAPTTNYHGIDLAARSESYQHSIVATGGFETMRVGFLCDLDEAIDVLNNWLMRSTVVTGPDAQTIWEGFLAEISIAVGPRKRGANVESVYNRIRCRYTDTNGVPATTSPTTDAASIALYGTHDYIAKLGNTTSGAAGSLASLLQAKYASPQQTPATAITTGDQGKIAVECRFRGWYRTLDWVVTSRTSTTSTATGTQIGDLVQTSGVGIGVTNAFLSTSRANIGSTGQSATEFIATDTTYLDKIAQLVAQGDGSDRWVLMCLEGRALTFRKWAGATPSTIDYLSPLGSHQVFSPEGALVEPWDVRPDMMYLEVGMLDAAPSATAYDTAARQYVERVTCSIDSGRVSVELEPAASDSLDLRLSLLGG